MARGNRVKKDFGKEVFMSTQNKMLYLIGSLRNKKIPELATRLRTMLPEIEIFDDWYSAGYEADDMWKKYEQGRGRSYEEALAGHAAKHVFDFDRHHLDRASYVLLVLPAGKSGHMEIMYGEYGTAAKTAILLDPEDVRWDVMYQFIPTIFHDDQGILDWVNRDGETTNATTNSSIELAFDRLCRHGLTRLKLPSRG